MALFTVQQMDEYNKKLQDAIQAKLKSGAALTDSEIANYAMTEDDKKIFDAFYKLIDGRNVPGFTVKDFIASPSAKVLIPRIIIGEMRKAADPVYLASKFYKKIRMRNGQAVMFPQIGVMRAHEVAEGQEINLDSFGVSLAV